MARVEAVDRSGSEDGEPFAAIPRELRERRQWVVWRRETEGTKEKKVPYSPDIGRQAQSGLSRAKSNVPASWRAFDDAVTAYATGQWDGIGYVFSAEDPYCGIDLDQCRDPQIGALDPWAADIVAQFATYTEVSPSGMGVKLWLRGKKPAGGNKMALTDRTDGAAIEVYDQGRFFTMTGQRLTATPTSIAERQAEMDRWYAATFRLSRSSSRASSRSSTRRSAPHGASSWGEAVGDEVSDQEDTACGDPADDASQPVPLTDEALLARARTSANGAKFHRLWAGDDQDYHGDASRGDLGLCRILAYWTGKEATRIDRLFRLSERYAQPGRAEKWDAVHYADGSTYGEMAIKRAIAQQRKVYAPGSSDSRRSDQRTFVAAGWQQATETAQDREKRRRQLSEHIADQVRAHLTAADDGSLLVVNAPPGSGKSTKVAELGLGRNIAYITERHDVAESVDALQYYHHIRPPTAETCDDAAWHAHFGALGFNTLAWHQRHACRYAEQFGREGSTLYMNEHVPTPYVARHPDGIIVDELNLPKWLKEYQFTVAQLRAARLAVPKDGAAARLLDAVDSALVAAERAAGKARYPTPLAGRALLDALDRACGGQLQTLVAELAADEEMLNPRRTLTEAVAANPHTVAPNILPHLLTALLRELSFWGRNSVDGGSGEWNGLVRLARVPDPASERATRTGGTGQRRAASLTKKVWALGITERARFHPEATRKRVLLDATANADVLRLLFDAPVQLAPVDEVPPPPGMRHLHLPTRYSLTSMRAKHGRDRTRATAQLKYLLRQLNPDGTKRVALITYTEVVDELGKALGIPEALRGWFWAERGSNKKTDADILLLVGTPALPPDEVVRLARALYQDDPTPIDDGIDEAMSGHHLYRDSRVQRLADLLTNAELTQCAHRNRPLWHDSRAVVSLCQGDIHALPVTEQILTLPELDDDGEQATVRRDAERAERCRVASLAFLRDGRWPSVAELRQATGLGQQFVSQWRREQGPQVRAAFAAAAAAAQEQPQGQATEHIPDEARDDGGAAAGSRLAG